MSKVPKELGKDVHKELQKVIDEWTKHIPGPGYYQNPKTQKIEREK